jgi:hypothetical protein
MWLCGHSVFARIGNLTSATHAVKAARAHALPKSGSSPDQFKKVFDERAISTEVLKSLWKRK